MIAIVDYNTGNLRSVMEALNRIGAEFQLVSDKESLQSADRVILPGVGEASCAMGKLEERGLDRIIPALKQPVLGICIGMQLMCSESEEGNVKCLDIFKTKVNKLHCPGLKIPHVGWNTVSKLQSPLFEGIEEDSYFYYVHSFAAGICKETVAETEYGCTFSAALRNGNFFGTQFHPEKSGQLGEMVLKNFLKM